MDLSPMSSIGTDTPGAGAPHPGQMPNVQIVGQYIKDLSFENPGAPAGMTSQPQIDFGIDLQARRGSPELYEVEMKIRVTAKTEDKALFLAELAYGALVQLTNMPDEAVSQVLLIQVPFLLFPFARRIIADVVRDGGMPPLMIEPIDFMALYQSKLAEGQVNVGGMSGNA
jgi:preprotein translocase subunit SecB